MDKAEELAEAFHRKIRRWLLGEALEEVDRINTLPEYSDGALCATHNYCDANEAMVQAYKAAFGRDIEELDDEATKLINAAWTMARANGFSRPWGQADAVAVLERIVDRWDNYEESGPLPMDDLMEQARDIVKGGQA